MDVKGISSPGGLANQMARQEFGAQVVAKTMDVMNDTSSSNTPITDKQSFGAAVVGKTLDYMNSDPVDGSTDSSHEFQKDVLGAALTGSRSIVDFHT